MINDKKYVQIKSTVNCDTFTNYLFAWLKFINLLIITFLLGYVVFSCFLKKYNCKVQVMIDLFYLLH